MKQFWRDALRCVRNYFIYHAAGLFHNPNGHDGAWPSIKNNRKSAIVQKAKPDIP